MLKILIVDDEPFFRLGIRAGVPWEEMDAVVCGEASNGREALQLIYEKHPDIVFLDIKMPVMDGIEVLKKAAPLCPNTYFVILSCFNEYEYVREAMKLGAYDYLFKPVMGVDELAKTVGEIRKKKYQDDSQEQASDNTADRITELLIRGTQPDGLTVQEKSELSGLLGGEDALPFFTVQVTLRRGTEMPVPGSQTMRLCQAILFQNMEYDRIYMGRPDGAGCLWMFCFASDRPYMTCRAREEVFRNNLPRLREYLEMEVMVGFSRDIESLDGLSQGADEALRACSEGFFTGESAVCCSPGEGDSSDLDAMFHTYYDRIQEALTGQEMDEVTKLLGELNACIVKERCFDREGYCHFLAMTLVGFMRKFRNGEILEQLLLEDYNLISNLYHQIDAGSTDREFLKILELGFRNACESEGGSVQETLVNQSILYMRDHYRERLTLNEIADTVHLNKNYFCKIFKQVTGTSPIGYLTDIRLSAATELLRATDRRVYEIAFEVGFQNYSHFCKTYRKYRNVSPADVRRGFQAAASPKNTENA